MSYSSAKYIYRHRCEESAESFWQQFSVDRELAPVAMQCGFCGEEFTIDEIWKPRIFYSRIGNPKK